MAPSRRCIVGTGTSPGYFQITMKRTQAFECPVNAALSVIGGRWKIIIIYNLFEGIARFNELQRATGSISKRVLTAQLRQLERDGIVTREGYEQRLVASREPARSAEPVA